MNTSPVGCWIGKLSRSSTVSGRRQLGAVAPFNDDEIDRMYAKLRKLEENGSTGEEGRQALIAAITKAEHLRAEEMAQIVARRRTLEPDALDDLFRRVDDALASR